ncbi:MAG: hypothetical protein ABSH32_00770 [Bryobacteraceae bacterium]|jgi:virginiamycin B lyase
MRILAALLLTFPAISLAQQVGIAEYNLPLGTGGVFPGPSGITAGPDGAMWFTEYWANNICRLSPSGTSTEYPVPTANYRPSEITSGPDGALWFTGAYGGIGRITTDGVITQYPLPTNLGGIITGPDGALWFTEPSANQIGRITTTGVVTAYPLPANPEFPSGSYPSGITVGPDAALWFTEYAAGQIGRITTAGQITEYPVSPAYGLSGIAAGPDGALWSTGTDAQLIVRTTTAGKSIVYALPNSLVYPGSITVGPDLALWFTATNLGRITTSGTITEYPAPPMADSIPGALTRGPDRELWFTYGTNGIAVGEAVIANATLGVSPPNGYFDSSLAFIGSGFAANENVTMYTQSVGSAVLSSAIADSSGSFSATAHAPQSAKGPRIFIAVGQTSGKVGIANFSMAPRLVLAPNLGPAGSTVTVEGYGFDYPAGVELFWDNPRTLLGTGVANTYGTFHGGAAVTFTVPADAPAGSNGVFGRDNTGAIGLTFFTVE